MTYLAVNADREFVPLKEIAEAESISLKYLESIARMLSKEHYIEGTSGRGGGYHLTRKPEAYKVGDHSSIDRRNTGTCILSQG